MFSKNRITAALAIASLLTAAPFVRAETTPVTAATPHRTLAAQRVLILAFNTIHLAPDQSWMTQSVHENIITNLSRSEAYDPIPCAGKVIVEDNQAAARIARAAHLPYAVRGTVQVVESEVRLTAQLVDAQSAATIRTAISTGPASDLLKVEDDLTAQLLGQPPLIPAAGAASTTAASTPGQPPVQIYIQNNTTPPPEPSNYSLAGYNNTPFYPGYYPGVVFVDVPTAAHRPHDGDHHGEHGHDGDHDGNSGGGTIVHFDSGPQNSPNTPGSAMNPGGINSNPDYHPVYTRPSLPGPTPGATPIVTFSPPQHAGTNELRNNK